MIRHGALACALLLAGCAGNDDLREVNYVRDQWLNSIRALDPAIQAVYPPSEDYQIGDVFAIQRNCTGSADGRTRSLRLGTAADAARSLQAHYDGRLQLPPTARRKVADAWQLDTVNEFGFAEDRKEVFYRRPGTKRDTYGTAMPIVDFPNYTIASGNAWSFSASLPGKVFGALFGASGLEDTQVRLSLAANSTFGLPVYRAQDLIGNFCTTGACSDDRVRSAFLAVYPDDAQQRCKIDITMAYRLFVTRGVEYEYLFRSAVAATAVAARLDAMKAFTEKAATLVDGSPSGATEIKPGDRVLAARNELLNKLLTSVNTDLKAISGAAGPGGSVAFGSYSAAGLTLVETYPRPLVFAYQGVYWPNGSRRPPDGSPVPISPSLRKGERSEAPTAPVGQQADANSSDRTVSPAAVPPTIDGTVSVSGEPNCNDPNLTPEQRARCQKLDPDR